MHKKFMRELAALGLPPGPSADLDLAPVRDADLAPLPESARRYLTTWASSDGRATGRSACASPVAFGAHATKRG